MHLEVKKSEMKIKKRSTSHLYNQFIQNRLKRNGKILLITFVYKIIVKFIHIFK